MQRNDYSQIKDISLYDCGLLSTDNTSMIDFIRLNDVSNVCDFLNLMDSNNFKRRRFVDTVNEARGLADLLKYKYFNVSLVIDCYLDSTISMGRFDIYGNLFNLPTVNDYSGNKINLYSAITRLGFSGEERNIILDKELDLVIGCKLVDLLVHTFEEVGNKENICEKDIVLLNKLQLVISYYRNKMQLSDLSIKQNMLYSLKNLQTICMVRDRLAGELDQIDKIISNYGGVKK